MPQEVASQKSELEVLLERNACTREGLSREEIEKATELIETPEYFGENCWVCEMVGRDNESYQIAPAIYDTGMCQRHARYALSTRK